MKKCFFCDEENQDDAVNCRRCSGVIEKKPQEKWYFKTPSVITAFVIVGPLALPLIWFNPRLNRKTKIITSIIIIIISYYLGVMFLSSIKSIGKYYDQLNQLSF